MSENGNDGGPSDGFNDAAVGTPAPEQDNFPSGERLLEDGVKHDSAYDAWAAQPPPVPELNHNRPIEVDDDWLSAQAQARHDHVQMVESYRQEFHEEIHGHREHFVERADPDAIDNKFNDAATGQHLNRDRE